MNRKRAIWAGIISALLIIGALTGCTQASATKSTSQYTDYTVTAGELKNTLSLEGYLTPAKTVSITTDQSSKVAQILKKKGNTVKADQDILVLENGNTVKAPAKGKITKMNVAVGDWVDSTVTIGTMYDYSTATTTSSGMGGSTTTYETVNISAETTSHVAKVDVKSGDTVAAGDKIAELENGNNIIAPLSGTISAINIAAGDKVTAQTQVATIVDTSNFYIEVSVNEIDAQQLKVGQSVDITINALSLNTTGKVTDISVEGTVSNSTTNFTVEIQLDEQNASYRTNMSAQVDILVANATDALSVPIDAVQTVNGKKVVMVKKDTAYTATEVETGISSSSYIQITSGLSAGDIVGVANSTSTFGGPGGMGGFDMVTGGGQDRQQGGQPPQMPQGGN